MTSWVLAQGNYIATLHYSPLYLSASTVDASNRSGSHISYRNVRCLNGAFPSARRKSFYEDACGSSQMVEATSLMERCLVGIFPGQMHDVVRWNEVSNAARGCHSLSRDQSLTLMLNHHAKFIIKSSCEVSQALPSPHHPIVCLHVTFQSADSLRLNCSKPIQGGWTPLQIWLKYRAKTLSTHDTE